ncbi:hypothetical protein IKW72_04105 [bacterium]|nr:hypothetical protein [bacterium]
MKKLLLLSFLLTGLLQAAEPVSCTPVPQSYDPNYWWMIRHKAKLEDIKERGDQIEVVFVGDSITHNYESVGLSVWNKHFDGNPYNTLNLGYGGDQTQNVLYRIQDGEFDGYKAKAIVLMIGTNNSGQYGYDEPPGDVIIGIKKVLEGIQSKQPQAKIILCSISPRGGSKSDTLRVRNDFINEEIIKFADGENIIWCDWGNQMLDADGRLSTTMCNDLLHPTVRGYEVWVKNVLPLLDQIVHPKNIPSCAIPKVRKEKTWWTAIGVRRNEIMNGDTSRRDVVFLGDSMLEGFYSVDSAKRKEILGSLSEFNLTFKNDLVQNILWRAKYGELHSFVARAVIIAAGNANTNDAPDNVAAGIKALAEGVRERQKTTRIVITPILPMGREKDSPLRKWTEEVNALVKEISGGNIFFVDPTADLLDENGTLPEEYSKDGVTLTKEGYDVWGDCLGTWIKSRL